MMNEDKKSLLDESGQEYSLMEYIFILKKHYKIIFLSLVLIILSTVYYTLVSKPIYPSSAVIMINEEQLKETSAMAAGAVQGYAGSPIGGKKTMKKFNEDEKNGTGLRLSFFCTPTGLRLTAPTPYIYIYIYIIRTGSEGAQGVWLPFGPFRLLLAHPRQRNPRRSTSSF